MLARPHPACSFIFLRIQHLSIFLEHQNYTWAVVLPDILDSRGFKLLTKVTLINSALDFVVVFVIFFVLPDREFDVLLVY